MQNRSDACVDKLLHLGLAHGPSLLLLAKQVLDVVQLRVEGKEQRELRV